MRSSQKILALVDLALSRIEVAAASVLLAAMVALVFVDVLLRYLADAPITGTAELAGTLFVWLVFLGSAAAARQRMHVAVGWFVDQMPGRWAAVVDRFALVAVVITLLLTAWFGFELMNGSRERTLPLTDIPLRLVYAAVPVGCVLMAVGFVAGWRRRDPQDEP